MRDYFIKELNAQRKNPNRSKSKRRKYVYFNSLLFLLSSRQPSLSSLPNAPIKEKATSSNNEGENFSSFKKKPMKSTRKHSELNDNEEQHSFKKNKQKDNKCEEYDEDICFSKMIVPMLRKLNEDQKHFAKIKILDALKQARSLQTASDATPSYVETQYQQESETETKDGLHHSYVICEQPEDLEDSS